MSGAVETAGAAESSGGLGEARLCPVHENGHYALPISEAVADPIDRTRSLGRMQVIMRPLRMLIGTVEIEQNPRALLEFVAIPLECLAYASANDGKEGGRAPHFLHKVFDVTGVTICDALTISTSSRS